MSAASAARAQTLVAVLSSDSGHYREAFEGFQEAWGSSVPYIVLGAGARLPQAEVIVAFGSRAAMSDWSASSLLVTCLAPGSRPAHDNLLLVDFLPDPPLLAARLKKLLPRLTSLRVLWSSELERGDVDELAAAAQKQGITVLSTRVADPTLLPERLRSFQSRAGAVWLMADPAIVNATNFAMLREYAKAMGIPFLAPADGLAEKGATATLATPFRDIGKAAAGALRRRLKGEEDAAFVHPAEIVVTVNAKVARGAGLDLTSASGVDRVIR